MSIIPAFEIGLWNAWILLLCLELPSNIVRLGYKETYKKMGNPSDMTLSKTEKRIGIIATLLYYPVLIYAIFLPLQLGTVWFYTGLAIFFLGLMMGVIAMANITAAPLDAPITKGLYRYSRHPIYLAWFLVLLGAGAASASWVLLLIAIVFKILTYFTAITEERFCLEKYGNTYREYMNRTPRWIGIPKSGK